MLRSRRFAKKQVEPEKIQMEPLFSKAWVDAATQLAKMPVGYSPDARRVRIGAVTQMENLLTSEVMCPECTGTFLHATKVPLPTGGFELWFQCPDCKKGGTLLKRLPDDDESDD